MNRLRKKENNKMEIFLGYFQYIEGKININHKFKKKKNALFS